MKRKVLVVGSIAILAAVLGYGQAAGPQRQPANAGAPAVAQRPPATGAAAAAANKAVLDQYCVTCHNDRAKTANLSLENLDFANIQNIDAELWERVVRKLRSGIMPPAGTRRPPEDQYAALRDFMEAQLDRKAAAAPNSGSVVLHRLNRAEYANVIRDLLAVEIDPALFLPTDDSANGFDNVAGSLTISPTLLEAYTSAAARIARMAVGYWRSPTEAKYIAPGDTSQNQHLEGLPLGTRGGMMVRHNFPADGEYTFEVQNYGLGAFIPGEQIEFLVDGERVALSDYAGVGLSSGNVRRERWRHRSDCPGQSRYAYRGGHVPAKQLSPQPEYRPGI